MPTLWASGVESMWDYLAIDLLGPSLDNLYRASGKEVMDLRSVCCIAIQVVSSIVSFAHRECRGFEVRLTTYTEEDHTTRIHALARDSSPRHPIGKLRCRSSTQ